MGRANVSDAEFRACFEELALEAGRAIMAVFRQVLHVESKPDLSPVTEADRAAEEIILAGLRRAYSDIPCVAEEEAAAGHAPQRVGGSFFLIDPLDGTREFVARSAEFTVNIALIRDGEPVVGAVLAPCSGHFFSAEPGRAEAIELDGDGAVAGRRRIAVTEQAVPTRIVASRSHRTPETDAFIRSVEAAEILSVGSSLKFCLIAAGQADLYPRFGRTMEWDTAAGDAILRAAGGLTQTADGAPLRYGKPGFVNPDFLACGLGAAARRGAWPQAG